MLIDPKTGQETMNSEQLAYYNMFFLEAMFELLAEKGILDGAQVLERVKKIKAESKINFPPSQ